MYIGVLAPPRLQGMESLLHSSGGHETQPTNSTPRAAQAEVMYPAAKVFAPSAPPNAEVAAVRARDTARVLYPQKNSTARCCETSPWAFHCRVLAPSVTSISLVFPRTRNVNVALW